MPQSKGTEMKMNITKILTDAKLTVSRSQGRRLTFQGGVFINDELITDPWQDVEVNIGDTIRVGKHKQVEVTQDMLEGV